MVRKIKRKQKKQMALITVIILLSSIVAIMLLTPAFNIEKIKVHGNSVLAEEEIIRASGIVKGVNIFGVSLGSAKDNIKSMGYIESVKVKRSLPSTIEITVVEEVGVAYIKAEEGYVIITADGRCIDITDGLGKGEEKEETQNAEAPQLPVVRGMKNVTYRVGNILKSEDERQMEALIACLHEFSKYGYIFDMSSIEMANLSDIKFYYRGKDLCVTVGSTEKLGYKMECFGPILSELGENPTGFINLERLTYKKEELPKPEIEENSTAEE